MLFDLLFPFPTRIRLFIYYSRERYLVCKTVFLLTRSMWKDLFSTMVGLAINNSGLFFLRLTDKLFSFFVTKCYDEIQDNSSTSNISPENIKLYSARRFLFCVFSTWNNEFYQQQKENGLILLHILHVTLSKIKISWRMWFWLLLLKKARIFVVWMIARYRNFCVHKKNQISTHAIFKFNWSNIKGVPNGNES